MQHPEQYFIIVPLLALMEICFSFDNAVMNATVLRKMNERSQRWFITWGMLFSVFLVRLALPAIIVTLSSHLGIGTVVDMAINNSEQYAALVTAAHTNIAAFGGTFLLLIFVHFLTNKEKEDHWLTWIEKPMSKSYYIPLGIVSVIIGYAVKPAGEIACLCAVLLFFTMAAIKEFLSEDEEKAAFMPGILAVLYLELLDASFSLDGVIGAFSMSSNIIIIMIGLGIGSFVVRSLTIYMVRKKTLEAFKYLEHGANWAIGGLGALMLYSLHHNVSQVAAGLIGILFIGCSVISSEVEARRHANA